MASTGSEQQLRFRWNDHMQHISKVLTLQRFEEQFCDVTLVSEDGFVMKAHQAILASTSAYFQRVFADITADQHPMVVLRGANFREMSCLLDYMYQGSTQVHQSLMESVLEVADMLEVKGLSQIRSNNSIKKFMAPPSTCSSTNTSTTSTHALPADNPISEHSRTPDEQSASHTQEEQNYRESQPRTAELESTWMRFSSNGVSEVRSKEPSRTHIEGPVTPTEEPPPASYTRVLPCQESSNQESQEESQMSGMDLSMAKNEPWSPKESSASDDKNSPSRKRRKLLEGICSEETLEPASDPDWGRIGSKVDDRPLCQPRTISFTSITSETDCYPENTSFNREDAQNFEAVTYDSEILASHVTSCAVVNGPSCAVVNGPVQLLYCSSASSPPKTTNKTKDYARMDSLNSSSDEVDEDPLRVPLYSIANPATSCSDQAAEEKIPVTSYVNLKHRERIIVRDADPARKTECLLEEKLLKPKSEVKRPLNPYMLFQNEMKKNVMNEYPGEPYQVTLKRLGYLWKSLSLAERAKWQSRADVLKEEHKRQNPDYRYNPYEAGKKRQQYLKARMERSRLYRISSENSIEGISDAVMVSPNMYKPVPKD